MKNSTWNPQRRNRNIGTTKSGYSQNNKFSIPERWIDSKIFWERLNEPVIFPLSINGHSITMFIEPTREGFIHAATPQDIIKVLELIDQEHLEEIENIVLRQPTTKDELLKPAWGIFVYYADLGRYSGPGVYLQAQERGKVLHWNKSLTPFELKELERLKTDGHEIRNVRRGYEIHTTPDSVRSTQLFRTLPHEIGHSVDYLTNSLNPSIQAKTEEESEYISKKYNSKPSHDKEEFAHRYATEFYERFEKKGSLPFPRIYDDKELQGIGLNPEWFNPN